MVGLAPKLVRLDPKLAKSGFVRSDFSTFGSMSQMYWNLIWKSPGFGQFGVQSDPLWSQTYQPWLIEWTIPPSIAIDRVKNSTFYPLVHCLYCYRSCIGSGRGGTYPARLGGRGKHLTIHSSTHTRAGLTTSTDSQSTPADLDTVY